MNFNFINSFQKFILAIKGNPVRRLGHLCFYEQPDYGKVRCINPSEVPKDWMCERVLRTSHRVGDEPLKVAFIMTSDKEAKTLPFLDYMRELYGQEIHVVIVKSPTHCPQPRGWETVKWGLRRIQDALASIEADGTQMENICSCHRVFVHSSENGITQRWKLLNAFLSWLIARSSIWYLIRSLLPFTVNFDFPFIAVYDAGAGEYVHLALGNGPGVQEELWRFSEQDEEEPTYGTAVHHVFPDIDSKNWHKVVSKDRSFYQVGPNRAWQHKV